MTQLSSQIDTSNFDHFDEEEAWDAEPAADSRAPDAVRYGLIQNYCFKGYTFKPHLENHIDTIESVLREIDSAREKKKLGRRNSDPKKTTISDDYADHKVTLSGCKDDTGSLKRQRTYDAHHNNSDIGLTLGTPTTKAAATSSRINHLNLGGSSDGGSETRSLASVLLSQNGHTGAASSSVLTGSQSKKLPYSSSFTGKGAAVLSGSRIVPAAGHMHEGAMNPHLMSANLMKKVLVDPKKLTSGMGIVSSASSKIKKPIEGPKKLLDNNELTSKSKMDKMMMGPGPSTGLTSGMSSTSGMGLKRNNSPKVKAGGSAQTIASKLTKGLEGLAASKDKILTAGLGSSVNMATGSGMMKSGGIIPTSKTPADIASTSNPNVKKIINQLKSTTPTSTKFNLNLKDLAPKTKAKESTKNELSMKLGGMQKQLSSSHNN